MPSEKQPLEALLDSLIQHVNKDVRGGLESVRDLLGLFPGQAPAEVLKSVRTLRDSNRNSIPALLERAAAVVNKGLNGSQGNGSPPEAPEVFLSDVGKLSAADLKSISKGLHLPAAGTKAQLLVDIRRWVESGGTYAAPDPKEQAERRAQELAGDLPGRLSKMDDALADEVIRRAESASKDKTLGADGFETFTSLLLGTPVKGSRPKLLKMIKYFVNSLAVKTARTTGF